MNGLTYGFNSRGVVRTEKIEYPAQYIPAMMKKVQRHHLAKTYNIPEWNDETHFLELLARASGRLLKGGEPGLSSMMPFHLFPIRYWPKPPPGLVMDWVEIANQD